jgi:hypothetical protein
MMLIETYVHVIGFFLTISLLGGYLTYRYFKKRK